MKVEHFVLNGMITGPVESSDSAVSFEASFSSLFRILHRPSYWFRNTVPIWNVVVSNVDDNSESSVIVCILPEDIGSYLHSPRDLRSWQVQLRAAAASDGVSKTVKTFLDQLLPKLAQGLCS